MGKTKCPSCGSTLTCSCKLRTASDGKSVCTNCISQYESTKASGSKKIKR